MSKQQLGRAIRLYKSLRDKEKETELITNDLHKAIRDLNTEEFSEYMKITSLPIKDDDTVEANVEEKKR